LPITTDFLSQLDRFNLIVKKRVTSSYTGPRRSLATGRGLLFKDHRIYAPGDDFRAIDWKVFARTDDLYIKNYEEERNLTVHIILDSSASMNYGKPNTKFEYASMLAVGFAYLAMKENEKFVFSNFSDRLNAFQPKRGRSNLISMVDYLNDLKLEGVSDIKSAITHYSKLLGSRSLVFLISDFMMPLEDIEESLYLFGKSNIKAIQVMDPIEKELKITGDYRLIDSETKKKLRINISPHFRQNYLKRLRQHNLEVEKHCDDLKYKYNRVTADMSIFDAFYKVLEG
jgi:uncharacterized protein (DUF58 family)